ncbi:MAG: hypothetical protein ABIH65_03210 [Nanoarchaeota archaeon]
MVTKKRAKKESVNKKPSLLRNRSDLAWKNFILFLVLFLLSFILWTFSSSELLQNFFGILSIILGFLAFAILIAFIVLVILKSGKK